MRGQCIICRKADAELTDEHVIPDALGGVYHCYKICKACNSMLGERVDNLLVNHYLAKLHRFSHGLKGKTGQTPNPFEGVLLTDTGERVRLDIKDGKPVPYLLPCTAVSEDKRSYRLTVDAADEKKIPAMSAKVKKRAGIDNATTKIETTKTYSAIEQPVIKVSATIDTFNFNLALLKIAYEHTVEQLPEYLRDDKARLYADILSSGDTARLSEVELQTNGLCHNADMLSQYIDYGKTKRHYLFLFATRGKLYCGVNIFNTFSQIIRMADKPYLPEGDVRILINDYENHTLKTHNLAEEIAKRMMQGRDMDEPLGL